MQSFSFFDDVTTFYPVLENEQHTATIWFNIGGGRWYLKLVDSLGNLILNHPVIESTRDQQIDMLAGFYSDVMIFNEQNQAFEINPPVPEPATKQPIKPILLWGQPGLLWA